MKENYAKDQGGKEGRGWWFLRGHHDKTWCLQAWRQAGFMPLDKQAVAERALKLGRGTQAVIGASSS